MDKVVDNDVILDLILMNYLNETKRLNLTLQKKKKIKFHNGY